MASELSWLARVAASTVVRRLTLIALAAVLAYVGIGKAHAGNPMETWQACMARVALMQSVGNQAQCIHSLYPSHAGTDCLQTQTRGAGSTGPWTDDQYFCPAPACPTGENIDLSNGQCIDPEQRCRDKNEELQPNSVQNMIGTQCIDGCVYGGGAGSGTTNGAITYGPMGFSGATCTTPTPDPVDPADDDPKCIPGNDGVRICVKPDGDHCYSASTGRHVCWDEGETGTKSDGPVIQTRAPGIDSPAPTPTPPAGETLSPPTDNTNTTTNKNGGPTINTTVNNYTTNNGTNGGPNNQGEPDPDSGGGEPTAEESEGTASGGEGCETPPVCGGDPVGCATLQQVWRTRCADNGNSIEGGGECDANGNPVFVCSGDQVLCATAEAQARAYCLAQKGDAEGPGWTDGDGPGAPGEGDGEDGTVGTGTVGVSTDMLDQENIFGAGSCPVFSVTIYGQTMTSASIPEWCDIVSIMRAVVLLMGAFAAVRILMGE